MHATNFLFIVLLAAVQDFLQFSSACSATYSIVGFAMTRFKLRYLVRCIFLLLVCNHVVQCDDKTAVCSDTDRIQLESPRTDENCEGLVEGRVQLCEGEPGERIWKNLCDAHFTREDVKVICRSLGYSDIGAERVQENQIVTATDTTPGVNCTGTEDDFSDCLRSEQDGRCEHSTAVMCFMTDSMAEQSCNASNETTPTDSDSTTPTAVRPGTSSSPPSPGTDPASNTISTTTSGPVSTATDDGSADILSSPSLYYLIGGLIAFVLLIVLIVICSLLCCCGWGIRRKDVSPADPGQEKGGDQALRGGEYATESLKKDYTTTTTTAHHQIQQSSQPIYEAINSNENSSTASQGSPSAKPVNPELYATLDQNNNTYAQIEPFIASPVTSPTGPDPNSYYQPLDHRTGSMKRGLPSTPIQAVNATALAIAKGEVTEGELPDTPRSGGSGIRVGSSTSLPRNTGYSSSTGNHHPLPPAPQRIELRDLPSHDVGDEPNFYHILEPPPDYSTLEEMSHVSTTATVSGSNRPGRVGQGSNNRHSSEHVPPNLSRQRSAEGSPALVHNHHHPRSATLPSNHSSPHSSRTSSVSSSPHVPRSNRSPLNNRANVSNHGVKPNKYSDSPSLSSSPQISQSPSKSNRLSNHSDGTDMVSATLV